MARVAEIIPELWLNRQGFFTIRGLKPLKGHGELDLVGYHPHDKMAVHVEVSASPDPRGFLGGEPAARIPQGVAVFVEDKYHRANIERVRNATCPSDTTDWKLILAHGKLNREPEVRDELLKNGVEPVSLFTMLTELSTGSFTTLAKLSGDLQYRLDTDADYFAYLAHAYARRTGGKP